MAFSSILVMLGKVSFDDIIILSRKNYIYILQIKENSNEY